MKWETNLMKTTLFVICFFAATAAFGQSASGAALLNAEPMMVTFPSHAGHASQHDLGNAQNLLEQSSYTHARGERPLWEVASPSQVTPLGDSARMLKRAHESAKKADIVWAN
jgi:hypothetical protein